MKRILTTLAVLAATTCMPVLAQTTGEITKNNCKAASEACQKAIDYCNEKKGKFGSASTTNALKDCMDSLHATGQLLGRDSKFASRSASISLDACNEAAKVCDQFKGDSELTSCANEVRKAAGNLSKVAK
jgi:hypothetical protein